jgi:tetratricopeptide (TPR) repeat protein
MLSRAFGRINEMLYRIKGWTIKMRLGREIKEMQKHAEARSRKAVENAVQSAQRALKNGYRQAAYEIWREALDNHRGLVIASRAGLYVLFGLHKFDEATALMEEGIRLQPQNPFFYEGAALTALTRGNDEEAVIRYEVLRRRFPNYGKGYREVINPLVALGRVDEADRLMRNIAENTRDPAVIAEYAGLAATRNDWVEALRRWEKIPAHDYGIRGIAECFRRLDRPDDAERILRDALKTPRPNALVYWIELAFVAEARRDWPEAVRRWANIRILAPSRFDGYRFGAEALRRCGREDEAEAIIADATKRFPKEIAAIAATSSVEIDHGADALQHGVGRDGSVGWTRRYYQRWRLRKLIR